MDGKLEVSPNTIASSGVGVALLGVLIPLLNVRAEIGAGPARLRRTGCPRRGQLDGITGRGLSEQEVVQ